MKYLFDVLTKNTQTLAGLYKYTKEGDEFRLYDPDAIPIEGFDVSLLGKVEKYFKKDDNGSLIFDKNGKTQSVISIPGLSGSDIKNINGVHKYIKAIDDPRKMLSTLDFDKALEWCDVYVCMSSLEADINNSSDSHKAIDKAQQILDHLMAAMNKKKQIFLGNRENTLYRKVLNEYDRCLNHIVTNKDLDDIKKYKAAFFENSKARSTKITFVVSTQGACGKMSNVLKIRNSFDKIGDSTAIIITEEIADFLDKDKYHIYPFLREFCDISLDDEILYLRCLIEKIINEVNPDRILITGQGGIGPQTVITEYTPNDCKPRGVLSNILLSAIGCDSVAIMARYTDISHVVNLVRYFKTTEIPVDEVCISPVEDTFEKDELLINDLTIPVNKVGEYDKVFLNVLSFVVRYPQITMFCKYMEITDKINALVTSNEFFEIWKQQAVGDILSILNIAKKEFMQISGNAVFNNAIGNTLETMTNKDVKVSDELWNKVLNKIKELKL